VRAVALSSRGVDPQESGECDALVEELLLWGGYYLEAYPHPDH
jgi:hypothetical protein